VPHACSSRIVRVVAYARGALVSREVAVPADLPSGRVQLRVEGVTPSVSPGSPRVEIDARDRRVLSARMELVIPPAGEDSPLSRELRDLERQRSALSLRSGELYARRAKLQGANLRPRLKKRAAAETAQAVTAGVHALRHVARWIAEIDGQLAQLERELAELADKLRDVQMRRAQASSPEVWGSGHPSCTIVLELEGSGPVSRLTVSYQVSAVRWWPAYQLRLHPDGSGARWVRQAHVAQRSGESWEGVELEVSTADFVRDRGLPQLTSLRLGKAQAPPRKAFRPPPEGLEELFVRYDLFLSSQMSVRWRAPSGTVTLPEPEPAPAPKSMPPPAPPPPPPRSAPMLAAAFAAPVLERKRRTDDADEEMDLLLEEADAAGGMALLQQAPEPRNLEPGEEWLDFDRLVLQGPQSSRRGRLRPAEALLSWGQEYGNEEGLSAPRGAVAPEHGRAAQDFQYAATGLVDVPSDGIAYLVHLGSAQGPCRLGWVTVPRESPQVFRTAVATNPFATGLLPGPLEVYSGEHLLLTSFLNRAGSGGEVSVGLGEEERIRVARNIRSEEEKGGLLGDQTALTHTVTIELRNLLQSEARVEVLDRYPVSDDKTLKIKLTAADAQEYVQSERGERLRGGLRWWVNLPGGGAQTVQYSYRVQFSAKHELEGGNRRD
jgi:hypothetical protein